MKNKLENLWEKFLDIPDNKVSVTKSAKPEDLQISRVPLKNIKKGINKVYSQININEKKK